MKQLKTKEDKVRLLKDLETGKIRLSEIRSLPTVWMKTDENRYRSGELDISEDQFNDVTEETGAQVIILPDNKRG